MKIADEKELRVRRRGGGVRRRRRRQRTRYSRYTRPRSQGPALNIRLSARTWKRFKRALAEASMPDAHQAISTSTSSRSKSARPSYPVRPASLARFPLQCSLHS